MRTRVQMVFFFFGKVLVLGQPHVFQASSTLDMDREMTNSPQVGAVSVNYTGISGC